MTTATNARIAGVGFLVYIGAGITGLMLSHHPGTRAVLSMAASLSALVLGVTLYAITRAQDRDLAMLAMACRFVEAVPGHSGGAIFFAVGSTIFSWLLLRGRMIPIALAWLGVIASAMLVALLPLQSLGLFGGTMQWSSPITWIVWFPLLIFELTLAFWLLTKGVASGPAPVR